MELNYRRPDQNEWYPRQKIDIVRFGDEYTTARPHLLALLSCTTTSARQARSVQQQDRLSCSEHTWYCIVNPVPVALASSPVLLNSRPAGTLSLPLGFLPGTCTAIHRTPRVVLLTRPSISAFAASPFLSTFEALPLQAALIGTQAIIEPRHNMTELEFRPRPSGNSNIAVLQHFQKQLLGVCVRADI
eukprot:scaffold1236_cov503-Prasinococcus_capsulatus_cf.AAC.7